jgi:acyl carrier protein
MTALTETMLVQFLNELRPLPAIDGDSALFSSGLIDSVGLVALVTWLERTCAFEVGPSDVTLENFDSVARVLRFAREKGTA